MSEAVISKIKKLLAMSEKNGASENEAATAMRMAASLALKHDIELSELATSDKQKEAVTNFVRNEPLLKWEVYIRRAAGHLFGVQVSHGTTFHWIGKPSDIENAEALVPYLANQLGRIYKDALAAQGGMTQPARAKFRKEFKEGCAFRVNQRAQELIKKMQEDDREAQQFVGSTALVVQHIFDEKAQDIRLWWDELAKTGNVKVSRRKAPKVTETFRSGYAAGDRVNLRQNVS